MGVVDVETEVGYALHAQQTFAQTEMAGVSRMDQYLGHLTLVRPQLPPAGQHLAVDGADAKERFVPGATQLKLQVISKLRWGTCAISTPECRSDEADLASTTAKLTSKTSPV